MNGRLPESEPEPDVDELIAEFAGSVEVAYPPGYLEGERQDWHVGDDRPDAETPSGGPTGTN